MKDILAWIAGLDTAPKILASLVVLLVAGFILVVLWSPQMGSGRQGGVDRQREPEAEQQQPRVATPIASPLLAGSTIAGRLGASSRWGSGWLDLDAATDFAKGDRLRLTIGGTADKILVRLLPKGAPPDESVGIIGGPTVVPKNRIVEVTLATDRRQIVHISVHGGPNPWGTFPLGAGNGPATLEAAELIR